MIAYWVIQLILFDNETIMSISFVLYICIKNIHYINVRFNKMMCMKKITGTKNKKYISLFFLYTIMFSANAQLKFHFGPRIGLGGSTFVGQDAKETNFPLGTIVGLYTHTDFAKKFSVDVELNYISVGSLFSMDQNTPEQRDYKVSFGYISLPVNLNYCFYKQIHLQFGIQTSALLTAVTEQKYQNVVTKGKNINDFHAIDVGPTIGCFYQFEKGLQMGVRYYRGVQNIFKDNIVLYNTGVQFLLTYQFSRANKEL